MTHKINHANIKEWAANYKGELFDGILCDPPYHLTSMSKPRADLEDYDNGKGNPYARRQAAMKGFMGKEWDGVDENGIGIAQDPEMWALLYKLLKPGAHLLAFSGSRTYHRMAVAIEDAGFEIRDMIEYVYGSGFPKSLNIQKQLEKQGHQEADTYAGMGTALKPSHEPICLARKPLDGTVANNVLKHGTGGLNIDGTRVGTETLGGGTMPDLRDVGAMSKESTGIDKLSFGQNPRPATRKEQPTYTGRFPANLIHDGSDEVEAVFPQTKNGGGNSTSKRETWLRQETEPTRYAGDSGSASRFFYTAKITQEELCESSNCLTQLTHSTSSTQNVTTAKSKEENSTSSLEVSCTKWSCATNVTVGEKLQGASHFYTAKASKSERNAGLEGFEEKQTPQKYGLAQGETPQQTPHKNEPRANHHPTVKPLSLTKYLATLIKPPTGGRLLVPFSGSGSEMIGALQAGWSYVEGVELTEEYIPIAEARIKYWLNISHKVSNKPKSARKHDPVQNEPINLTLI